MDFKPEEAHEAIIMEGQCDNQSWGFGEEYWRLLPEANLEIMVGAGHIIGEEHQKLYLELVIQFLN